LTVKNRSEGATALVGIAAMSVVAQCVVDGEWHLEVETTADVVGCGGCGCRAVGHTHSPDRTNPKPSTTLDLVEPAIWGSSQSGV
jgi:cell division GTPase FtsZ